MTVVLVDSNVLLDVISEDARWFWWSEETIKRTASRFRLVINPIEDAKVNALPQACVDRA